MPTTLEFAIKPSSTAEAGLPKYQILADLLRRQISEGKMTSGDRLPTFAEIGSKHHVTLTTVKRVYDLLEKEGLIERHRGRGTFVAEQKKVLTGTIGLIGINVSRYQHSPYYHHILRGIEEYTRESGQHIMFAGDSKNLTQDLSAKMDGFLFYGAFPDQEKLEPYFSLLPRVSMLKKEEGISNVVADDYEGAKSAVRHLIKLGHRRIACLMEKGSPDISLRLAGYRDALGENAGHLDAKWVRLTGIINTGPDAPTYLEWGKSQMHDWLRDGWHELGCTAIVVQNDTAAIGVMQALHEAEIKVPGQVSVIGFDGTELCDHTIPRLTSMKVPLAKIGYTAAQILHAQIKDGQQENVTTMLPMRLRAGGSVAEAP